MDVQCYELFGGIAPKNHAFSFFSVLVDKINASRITSSRSLKSATFLLAGWRFSHPTELPGDLPVLLECHTLSMNMIKLQLSDAVADISMLQCSAQFRILFINAHFVASHALASASATLRPTLNIEEEVVVIRNGCTLKKIYCMFVRERCEIAVRCSEIVVWFVEIMVWTKIKMNDLMFAIMPSWGTIDVAFIFRRLQRECRVKQRKIGMCFVDL